MDIKNSPISSLLFVNSNLPHGKKSGEQEFMKKIGKEDGSPLESPAKETRTFAEKVKRCINEEQENREILLESLGKEPVNTPLVNTIRQTPDYKICLQQPVSEKIKIKEEKDPGSFILPYVIGNTTVINALADLGASISVMPYLMFKRLGLGTPKPISMVIELADRSMKISLEVGNEKVIFNANEGKTLLYVCVINDFQIPNDFEELGDPEEFLMSDDINGDLGDFLEENDLLREIN
nr:hypothetical protein [Tanacetum cinerariifolium]